MNAADQWFNLESSLSLPDLHGRSDILEQQHIRELSRFLPARAEGYAWTLAFTAATMGFSLKSLYRSLSKYEGPVLLIIKDDEHIVFGAFCSCSLLQSESFYGTGETYLFTFKPNQALTTSNNASNQQQSHHQQQQQAQSAATQFKRYPWTGDNLYFIKGNADSIVIGAGEGNYGLWLDEDLYHGTTNSCKTFNNEPLTNRKDFVVSALECWCFL